MKYAVILDTGSILQSMRPSLRMFEEKERPLMEAYISEAALYGNKCHVFEYKETKQLQKTIVSTTV